MSKYKLIKTDCPQIGDYIEIEGREDIHYKVEAFKEIQLLERKLDRAMECIERIESNWSENPGEDAYQAKQDIESME